MRHISSKNKIRWILRLYKHCLTPPVWTDSFFLVTNKRYNICHFLLELIFLISSQSVCRQESQFHVHRCCFVRRDFSESYRYKIYRWLIFSRIKTAIGLDRCAIFMSVAAPMATETIQHFMSADIPVTGVSPISNLITMRLTKQWADEVLWY